MIFEKLPVPEVQVELVALPPTLPAKVMLDPPQTVCGNPASAVAAGFTVITTVLTAPVQGPAPSGSFVVKVKVTVPEVIEGV